MAEYIKREDVLMLKNKTGAYGMDISSKDVEKLPAADVREYRGADWKLDERRGVYICSNCGGAVRINSPYYCPWCGELMRESIGIIRTVPPSSVVEVVRCKDCFHREGHFCLCPEIERDFYIPDVESFFCAYGEKRGESNG